MGSEEGWVTHVLSESYYFLHRADLTEAYEHIFSCLLSELQIKTVINLKLYIFVIRPQLTSVLQRFGINFV